MEIQLEGLAELRARLERMRSATQNLQPALLRSGLVAMKAAQDRIDAGGPGWAPNLSHTPLLHRTGRLLASLTVGGSGSVSQLTTNEIVVGTNVEYAVWLQDGTGIYAGGSPITPKSKKFLAFDIGGTHVFVRSIKGTPSRRFLFIDQQVSDRVAEIFAKHVMGTAQGANA
jgi:phage gpG-like protein